MTCANDAAVQIPLADLQRAEGPATVWVVDGLTAGADAGWCDGHA
jgi:hypothetical protein